MFVGSGAPKGKELDLPGRHDTDQILIGIEWLESIHFGHIESIGERVLIIGVGNTAMDCCRSAKRLGATDVKVDRAQDAQVLQGLALGTRGRRGRAGRDRREPLAGPLRHRERQADRDGVRQLHLARRERQADPGARRPHHHPVRHGDPRDRPGERVPLDRARHRPRVRQVGHAGRRQDDASVARARACSSAATPRSARRTSSGRWRTDTQAAISIHNYCQGVPVTERPDGRHDADQHQDGPARVGLQQRLQPGGAPEDEARRAAAALLEDDHRGGAGLHRRADRGRGGALPQLRRPDALHRLAVHRVRRVHRHLPGGLPDDHAERRGTRAAHAPDRAGRQPRPGPLRLRRR